MGRKARISELSLSWVSGHEDTDTASWREWAIGVDCHSRFLAVCVLIPDFKARTVRRIQKRVDANFQAIREAKSWVQERLRAAGHRAEPFSYCLESTGCYHVPVIHAWAGEPCVINPSLAGTGRRKTDKLDAQTLARNHLSGLWGKTWFPSPAVLELRCIDRARRNAGKIAHRALMSIGTHLLSFGYTFTASGSLGHQEVRPHIEDLCEGKPTLLETAHCHLSDVPLPRDVGRIILDTYKTYDVWNERASLLLREMVRKVKTTDWPTATNAISGRDLLKLLQTIPGVGELTAALWAMQIGDPRRFLFTKQIVAYCGFDPSLKVSAGNVTAHVRRKGNKILHAALIQCGQSVLRRAAEPLGWWGQGIAQKGKGGWQRAIAAIARRIAIGLWICQTRQVPWSYEGYRTLAEVQPSQTDEKKRRRSKKTALPSNTEMNRPGFLSEESSRPDASAS